MDDETGFQVTASDTYESTWDGEEWFDKREDAVRAAERLSGKLGIPITVTEHRINALNGLDQDGVGEYDPDDGWRDFQR